MTYVQYSALRLFGQTDPEKAAVLSADKAFAADNALSERQLITIFTARSIRAALISLGMTQKAAAVITGVPLDTISAWCAPDDSPRKRVPPRYVVDLLIYALCT